MTPRRTKPPPRPRPPDPPSVPWPEPEWSLLDMVDVQACTLRIRQMSAHPLHLPPVQRGIVWTPEQQLALVQSVWSGLPVAPIIVWQQQTSRGDVRWLLDGQQRATSLGLDVRTVDGVRRPTPPTRWDWRTGTWSLDAGEPTTLAELADVRLTRAMFDLGVGLELSSRAAGQTRASDCCVTSIVIGGWSARVPVDRVVAAFRALATPGVLWTETQIAEISGSMEGWEVALPT